MENRSRRKESERSRSEVAGEVGDRKVLGEEVGWSAAAAEEAGHRLAVREEVGSSAESGRVAARRSVRGKEVEL